MGAKIYGLGNIKKKLSQQEYRRRLERGIEKALLFAHGSLPGYPAPPPRSRYRRTGTLGKSITTRVEKTRDEVRGIIGTALRYAPWVISSRRIDDGRGPQAWMHRGRWWTLQEEIARRKSEIVRIVREILKSGG